MIYSGEGSCPKFIPIEDDLYTPLSPWYIFSLHYSRFFRIKYAISAPEKVVKDYIYTKEIKHQRNGVHDSLFS
jgi:hypothetical protein